ncbi:MAG: molybdopterin cofactor-binding domain-containing protein, partial [Limnohabitans sp.]
SFGSIVAQVAEVSVTQQKIKVHRVWCVIDCGTAINPDLIAQQMEGSVAFALSAALYGRIQWSKGRVQQSNFHDYQVLRMPDMPQVDTFIMASNANPEGVGEPGTPPLAPAVANALFTLTGQRLRSLPLNLAAASA